MGSDDVDRRAIEAHRQQQQRAKAAAAEVDRVARDARAGWPAAASRFCARASASGFPDGYEARYGSRWGKHTLAWLIINRTSDDQPGWRGSIFVSPDARLWTARSM